MKLLVKIGEKINKFYSKNKFLIKLTCIITVFKNILFKIILKILSSYNSYKQTIFTK
jgi:hypothetical protein